MHFTQIIATKIEEEKATKKEQKERTENKKLYERYVKDFDVFKIFEFGRSCEPWVRGAEEKAIRDDNKKLEDFFKFNDKELLTVFLEKLIKEYEEEFFNSSFDWSDSYSKEYKRLGQSVVKFSKGTKAPKPLINKFKKCLANIELASKKGWYEKQKKRILSNDFNSVAEIEKRQQMLRTDIAKEADEYHSRAKLYEHLKNHNANIRPVVYRDNGGVEHGPGGATRWAESPTPYYAGTNEVAYNAPQREDRREKETGEAMGNWGRCLVNSVNQAMTHKLALENSKNKTIKKFLKTKNIDSDLKKIYNCLVKMDKNDLQSPDKIFEGLKNTYLLYGFRK